MVDVLNDAESHAEVRKTHPLDNRRKLWGPVILLALDEKTKRVPTHATARHDPRNGNREPTGQVVQQTIAIFAPIALVERAQIANV